MLSVVSSMAPGCPADRPRRLTRVGQLSPVSVSRQRLPARHRHRLEPGVGPDGVEQVADVIADGLPAQVQVLGDLCGRAAPLELAQNLGLAWCEAELRVGL